MPLSRITDAGGPLHWAQPNTFSREYQLTAGSSVVARLEFGSFLGSLATGTSGDGCWTFKRTGFIATSVTVRACGSEENVAVFRNSTWASGGTLEMRDGRSFPTSSNFWQTKYEICTEKEEPLIRFSRIGGVLHFSADVEILDAARQLPELPWLVMLGWYLAVMQHQDGVAAT
jgi:hypothetical protein